MKQKIVSTRLTQDEFKALKTLADKDGRTISQYLARKIRAFIAATR